MKSRTAAIGAATVALSLTLFGCGGSDDTNSGDRPSAEELSEVFAAEFPDGTPTDAADCLGEKLEASDLPNGVLRGIVAGDEEISVDADNEEKYTEIVTDATQECISESIGG